MAAITPGTASWETTMLVRSGATVSTSPRISYRWGGDCARMRALGIHRTTELVAFAIRQGLVPDRP
jgi:hypothetical protein